MKGKIDVRIYNYLAIVLLSVLSFAWTAFIFRTNFTYHVILTVVFVRICCSIFILKDHTMSWWKVSQISFIIKSLVYACAFVIYMPILYTKARIAFLMSEAFTFLLMINFLMYCYYYIRNRNRGHKTISVIVYGAGKAGLKLADELRQGKYLIKYFVDDNTSLQNTSIDGIRIISAEKLKCMLDKGCKFNLLIIAMPVAPESRVTEIGNDFSIYFEKTQILPSLDKILSGAEFTTQLKDITLEDLLARNPKDLDKDAIRSFVVDKTVLVTGAGGSIGSEICRQCVKYGVKKLILIDHSEFNLFNITEELNKSCILPILMSVTDKRRLVDIFLEQKPDIVIHAAAYKQVPICEEYIPVAIENNVIGTKNVADAAIEADVRKMILISTDKAVRPTNVMGATKRICELYVQNVDSKNTDIMAVRFGNVIGSSGSAVPKFRAQIAAGGPVTVTHPEITRYFMLIPEACELVLQAGAIGKKGDIFILDMGKPVKILDLAKKMIALSGAKNIDIKFIGLRPGEKLYEELLINDTDVKTRYNSITVAKSTKYDIDELNIDINELISAENQKEKLMAILNGEYVPADNKHQCIG